MPSPRTITLGAGALEGLTVRIRFSAPMRFRLWLAAVLIRIAARLVGGKADIAVAES